MSDIFMYTSKGYAPVERDDDDREYCPQCDRLWSEHSDEQGHYPDGTPYWDKVCPPPDDKEEGEG